MNEASHKDDVNEGNVREIASSVFRIAPLYQSLMFCKAKFKSVQVSAYFRENLKVRKKKKKKQF